MYCIVEDCVEVFYVPCTLVYYLCTNSPIRWAIAEQIEVLMLEL
jgi:hypothetical protein